MSEENQYRIEAISGVNQRGEGFVHINYVAGADRYGCQATPAEARQLAQQIVEAAEAAETDSFIYQFMQNKIGLDPERSGMVLIEFRQWREISGGVKNRGKDDPHWQDAMKKKGAS